MRARSPVTILALAAFLAASVLPAAARLAELSSGEGAGCDAHGRAASCACSDDDAGVCCCAARQATPTAPPTCHAESTPPAPARDGFARAAGCCGGGDDPGTIGLHHAKLGLVPDGGALRAPVLTGRAGVRSGPAPDLRIAPSVPPPRSA